MERHGELLYTVIGEELSNYWEVSPRRILPQSYFEVRRGEINGSILAP